MPAMGTYSALVTDLLTKRGITDSEDVEKFLSPNYDSQLHDPMLLVGMEDAVRRILKAIEGGEHIAIYADFDCDGIPAAVVLSDFFNKIGYERVHVYIPHRHNEGYGLHTGAIDSLAKRGISLMITVDLGTTAGSEVRYAHGVGMDVIVTDHHELNGSLPEAIAVINPKRKGYPFPDLCGAGVAYKVVQALISEGRTRAVRGFDSIPDGWEKWLLDMVGIATIADMVPLVGENRVLAHFGLAVLRKSPRPGLAALLRKLRVSQRDITEDDIGFLIGPRINAASRMDVPELAFRLLSTKDVREAEAVAGELEDLNRKRKGAVAATVREVNKRLVERHIDSPVVVLGDPNWRPALLGLAANSVLDRRGGIVCLWGRDGAGRLKGSCRSDGSASVVDLFVAAGDKLEQFGGHHASGGFSVSHEYVHTLPDIFRESFANITQNDVDCSHGHGVDMELALTAVSSAFWRELVRLAPFGVGNPKPVFLFPRVEIIGVRHFGKGEEHLELSCSDGNGTTVKAIQFFANRDALSMQPESGAFAHVVGTVERSVFGGRTELRLRLVDILPCAQ
jgi:single-stranded-DNA-specific exonuclease